MDSISSNIDEAAVNVQEGTKSLAKVTAGYTRWLKKADHILCVSYLPHACLHRLCTDLTFIAVFLI